MERGGTGGGENSWTLFSTLVAMDSSNFYYRACSICERTLPDDNPSCRFCNRNTFNPGSKRFYRLLLSVATVDKVIVVICFDRAARVLFGCSADEFFDFCRLHPFAAAKAGEILEGEMCQITLSRPRNGNAQHLRVVSIVPMRTGFRPAIETLRKVCGVGTSGSR